MSQSTIGIDSRLAKTLLIPAAILLVATLVAPTLWALVVSFSDYRLGRGISFIGFENYARIFSRTPEFWMSVIRTFAFTFVAVGAELLVGVGMALVLSRGFKLQRLWVSLVIAPMAVSPVIGVIVWRYMLAPDIGLINFVLDAIGITPPNWFVDPLFVFGGIILIDVWMEAPFVFAIVYPALISIEKSLREAATIDGASPFQTFRYVVFPLASPAIITAGLFRLIFALRMFGVVWLFARGGPAGASRVLSIFLYEQSFVYWQFGLGSAIAWVLLIITVVVAAPQLRLAFRRVAE